MSKIEKALKRLSSKPTDFEWSELKAIMQSCGFELKTTGGSGRKFIQPETGATHFIHEPHPSKILKAYQLADAVHILNQAGVPLMSQTLQYKGYDGSVLYSAEDRLLHGRILGIRDMVSFEGTDVESLETNFQAAVDEYLAFCEAEGKTPNIPFKGSFNVRISQDLHHRATLFAEQNNRKLNTVVSDALKDYLSKAS